MTVETEVANLTIAVDGLTTAVNVSKATLDSSVADSVAARDASQAARDTASTHKTSAEAAAASATNTASALTGFDLTAIAATKTDTAVDVFVYDTSKDSDGGKWRKRTQGTSWYNETLNTATRGSRKEFPAVAVIVAESNQVTIYDGDDPDLPMWMVFNARNKLLYPDSISSVVMQNGLLASGGNDATYYGFVQLDFISEESTLRTTSTSYGAKGPISERNSTFPYASLGSTGTIVNVLINDIAMTVLPNAPIDAATGLPVPTIAVATDGGLSVITDSGAVYDSDSTTGLRDVAFDEDNTVYYMRDASSYALFMAEPSDYTSGDGFGTAIASTGLGSQEFDLISNRSQTTTAFGKGVVASGGVSSSTTLPRLLGLYALDKTNLPNTMAAGIHYEYNTGWMNGDIKLATLSDTDDTDVTGSELVTNGTFDSDLSGWTTTGWSYSSGAAQCDGVTTAPNLSQNIAIVAGKTYVIEVTVSNYSSGACYVVLGGVQPANNNLTSNGAKVFTVTTTSTSGLFFTTPSGTYSASIDNVSVRLAEEDRSVNGNGLQVFGTVTKNPVATGADLVAYSGFSISNYLYQPYNSDLDFGTGDFCIMGWANHANASASQEMVSRGTSSGTSFRFMYRPNNPDIKVQIGSTSNVFTETEMGGISISGLIGTWVHFVALRRNGVVELYINGEFKASDANTENVTRNINEHLVLGNGKEPSNSLNVEGSMALWRISATAPSPEQIAKIYEDEKVLFQENAQATLYGSSDAVTALAYDDTTELLHVGTSDGRSVFQGLRRVSNTTDAITAAISASNNLVAED